MICQPCSTAGDLLTDQIVHESEHFHTAWLMKANEHFLAEDPDPLSAKIAVIEVVAWLHDQCRSITQDKTWCDCQHKLESSRQKEFVSADEQK